MVEELFRSTDLLVRATFADGCDRCVVTFDNHGSDPDLDQPGFGERFFAERGISIVVVRGRGNHWYQYPDMMPALAIVRGRLAGHSRVMTYGSSMGGYAALRFADAVGANACLALSPQYSNNPAIVPWEIRWLQDATTIEWRREIDGVLWSDCKPIVVYDPTTKDRRHVELIAAATRICEVAIPHAAHPVGTYLASAGLLEQLVRDALDGTLDPAAFAAEARRRQHGNPVYLAELAKRQPAHRQCLAIALARQALSVEPHNALLLHILAALLTTSGNHAEAIPLHEESVRQSGSFLVYAIGHCEALIAADDRSGALAATRHLVKKHGSYAYIQSLWAHVLWRNRCFLEAVDAAEQAAAMVPSNRHYAYVVALYRHRRRPSTRLRKLLRGWLRLPPIPDRVPGWPAP